MTSQAQVRRLLSLVPYLREHDGIAMTDVAAAFGITLKTLREDLSEGLRLALPVPPPDRHSPLGLDPGRQPRRDHHRVEQEQDEGPAQPRAPGPGRVRGPACPGPPTTQSAGPGDPRSHRPGDGLHLIRSRGWAQSHEERERGVASVSAPVFGPAGMLIAAVSVSGPVTRIRPATAKEFAPAVLEAAREIGAALGADQS